MNKISNKYLNVRRTNNTKRLQKGVLEKIIKETKEKHILFYFSSTIPEVRHKWCNFENFERMNNLVYETMKLTGVVKKLPIAQWLNKRGECVRKEHNLLVKK